MYRNIQEIILDLESFTPDGDYMTFLENITEEIDKHPHGSQAIPAMFSIIEKYPDEDFGCPGPLVHVLETFLGKGYEKNLIESIHRKVTYINLSMLNRLTNKYKDQKETVYFKFLSDIAQNSDIEEDLREQAMYYLEYYQ